MHPSRRTKCSLPARTRPGDTRPFWGTPCRLQEVVTCFPLVLRLYRMGWVSITLTKLMVRARTAGCLVKDGPWVWICIVGGRVCGERWRTLSCFGLEREGGVGLGWWWLLSVFVLQPTSFLDVT